MFDWLFQVWPGLETSATLLSLEPPGWGANLLRGALNSLVIALGAFALGCGIGIGGALGKLGGGPVTRDLLAVYTTVVRAVPELILILLLYYAGTDLLNQFLALLGQRPVEISGLVAGIGVLGIVQGAYATEVLRGAIQSVPRGQTEAARAFGMTRLQTLRRVTFPGDAAARPAGPVEPVADRHQGHGAAGDRRFFRTDAGNAASCRIDARLFYLLHGGGGDLSLDDAGVGAALCLARDALSPWSGARARA